MSHQFDQGVQFGEKCAVVGVIGGEACQICRDCLHALNHRGQDSGGMVTGSSNDRILYHHKGLGTAGQIFDVGTRANLVGNFAVGHNRYATAGPADLSNAQPHLVYPLGLAYAGNGDIPPAHFKSLSERLKEQGIRLSSQNDGELIAKILAQAVEETGSMEQAVERVMSSVVGSFASVAIHNSRLYAWRDPLGIRPLVLGKTPSGWVVASETCALDLVRGEFVRDVKPGELLVFADRAEPQSLEIKTNQIPKQCVFELIYFSRPDSVCFGVPVNLFREFLGALLAPTIPKQADCISPVPDSSNFSALGLAQACGSVPFKFTLLRNHYVGRTFILPSQMVRDDAVRLKLNPIKSEIKGRNVVLVDDSIVRGTTSRHIVKMLRNSGGANEVHLRITSPPTRFPCYYGVATPTVEHLLAGQMNVEEMRRHLEVDSLNFISLEELDSALQKFGQDPNHFCRACFSGQYPTSLH